VGGVGAAPVFKEAVDGPLDRVRCVSLDSNETLTL